LDLCFTRPGLGDCVARWQVDRVHFRRAERLAPSHTAQTHAGIADSRYLFQLEGLTAEANRQATPELMDAAACARKVLFEIMWSLNVDISYYETAGEELPGPVLDRLREKVAEEIMKMQRISGNRR